MLHLAGLDHLVLTVADIGRTLDFYTRVLGMRRVDFGAGRVALQFGAQKINLHPAGGELTPHAATPRAGSADLCFVVEGDICDTLAHLAAQGVTVEAGPVPRTGARGDIVSIYLRDPDGNLLELGHYGPASESCAA